MAWIIESHTNKHGIANRERRQPWDVVINAGGGLYGNSSFGELLALPHASRWVVPCSYPGTRSVGWAECVWTGGKPVGKMSWLLGLHLCFSGCSLWCLHEPGPTGPLISSHAEDLGSVTRSPFSAWVLNLYVSHKYIFYALLKSRSIITKVNI